MAEVKLPDFPKGQEFEEFISAYFQASGLYIERHIIDRGVEEVLELDVITTDYDEFPPDIRLLEIKSGKWGFADIFKLRGWLDYLNMSRALLVASQNRNNFEFYKEKSKSLSIDVVVIDDLQETASLLYEFYPSEEVSEMDVALWRFSYWVERNLLRDLNHKKKSSSERKCFSALEKYYYDISSGIFFTENIVERVEKLYDAYRRHPRISARCAHEAMRGDFEEDVSVLPLQVYKETYYRCIYNDIQISTFVEHRARLALLKSAVDYKLYERAGIQEKVPSVIKFLGFEIPSLHFLPDTFVNGLEVLSEHPYFHRYPVFWQWFLWLFGGFIMLEREEEEYRLLSKKTGIPVQEIPKALQVYEILFPLEKGWFMDLSPNSRIRLIRMHSVPFMGIGANLRRLVYAENKRFDGLELSGLHTVDDLIKWNNLLVEVLQKS